MVLNASQSMVSLTNTGVYLITDTDFPFKDDDFRHNPAMFLPFANGQTNCVGRSLALIELRCTVAILVRKFIFHAGKELDILNWESQLEDYHMMKFADVPVIVERRKFSS